LDRLRLEDRVLDMVIPAVERRSLLGPHREDEPDGLFHLSDAHRRACREFPAILAVLCLEITGADTERQPPPRLIKSTLAAIFAKCAGLR